MLDEVAIKIKESDLSKLKVLNDSVLVEVFDNRREQNGVFIPITEDNPFIPDRGVVKRVAETVACVKPDDCVIIERYKGRRVYTDANRQFILLNVGHVLAKCEPEDVFLKSGADGADMDTLMPCC